MIDITIDQAASDNEILNSSRNALIINVIMFIDEHGEVWTPPDMSMTASLSILGAFNDDEILRIESADKN